MEEVLSRLTQAYLRLQAATEEQADLEALLHPFHSLLAVLSPPRPQGLRGEEEEGEQPASSLSRQEEEIWQEEKEREDEILRRALPVATTIVRKSRDLSL